MKWLQFSILLFLSVSILVFSGCITPKSVSSVPQSVSSSDSSVQKSGSTLITVSMNEALRIETYSGIFDISALEVIRGTSANNILKSGNMFNSDPDPGFEYLLVRVKERYIKGESSKLSNSYNFKVYVDGTGYSPSFVIFPDNMRDFKSVTLLVGGQNEGWIAFMVPVGRPAQLSYETLFEPVGFINLISSSSATTVSSQSYSPTQYYQTSNMNTYNTQNQPYIPKFTWGDVIYGGYTNYVIYNENMETSGNYLVYRIGDCPNPKTIILKVQDADKTYIKVNKMNPSTICS